MVRTNGDAWRGQEMSTMASAIFYIQSGTRLLEPHRSHWNLSFKMFVFSFKYYPVQKKKWWINREKEVEVVGSRPGLVVMLIVEPISLHSGPRTQWGLYIYTSSFDLIITGSLNPSEMKPVAPTWFVFSSLLCATSYRLCVHNKNFDFQSCVSLWRSRRTLKLQLQLRGEEICLIIWFKWPFKA